MSTKNYCRIITYEVQQSKSPTAINFEGEKFLRCCGKYFQNFIDEKYNKRFARGVNKSGGKKFRPFHVSTHNKRQKQGKKIISSSQQVVFHIKLCKVWKGLEEGGERNEPEAAATKKGSESVEWKIMKFMKHGLLFEVVSEGEALRSESFQEL